jgi:hypothetical protein
MAREHREYNLRDLPLERMSCVGKNSEQLASSATALRHQNFVTALSVITFTWRLCPRTL